MTHSNTASTDPFAGVAIKLQQVRSRRWEARLDFDPTLKVPKPGYEAFLDLVGKGRSEERACEDLNRKLLAYLEEVGLVAFSYPTYSVSISASASTGSITIPL